LPWLGRVSGIISGFTVVNAGTWAWIGMMPVQVYEGSVMWRVAA